MRPTLGKHFCGMAASLIILLAGGWLILAPFALGYQPYGAAWTNQTVNDFATGIPIVVVALISCALFFNGLLGSLRATGILVAQPQPQGAAFAPQESQLQPATSQAAVSPQSDLDRTLATLAAALAADLTARNQAGANEQNDQQIEHIVNRREA